VIARSPPGGVNAPAETDWLAVMVTPANRALAID
jgi:hypothetical protein